MIVLCSSIGAACYSCDNMQPGMDPPSSGEEDGKTPQEQCEQVKGQCLYDDDNTPLYINSYPLSDWCSGSCANSEGEVNYWISQSDCESVEGFVWRTASFVGGTWTPVTDQADRSTCEAQGVGWECKVRRSGQQKKKKKKRGRLRGGG